ncbi:Phosphogluconate repressor HexR [Salmonella enterica subsp. enterica serovar Urbana str. R8-2977]|uniref:Phosphogluconate repressor HexR n=1 Tax=Salmonella enterica subsp. enterica serovar Urbana str. R8-2977 TaxID=913084 RepID=G5RU65_SALET|nr:Phosphogluconate repressor HexR [Salmonella enterica subsp. enterica serovar Urbana str. R8-2977]
MNRFCRSMNTRGFPDFKLHLAQSLANGTPYVNRNVDEDDSVEAYTGKIFESAMASLDHVRQSLDKSAVNRAVDLLTQAKKIALFTDPGKKNLKIAFFGLGSSAAVAHDAMNKFFRFNVPVIYSDDIVLQRMSCMNCNDDDVVVLISHTGRTKSLVELAQLARENDAMVIALTSAGTPLAREATLAITLDVPEDTDIYMPMVSRLAQLTVIDVLATGFTLRRGAKFRDNLKRVKEALKESRFDKELLIRSDDR